MATFGVYRTARTPKECEDYPRCTRGIQPGERYYRATATPRDSEVNQSDHWRTLIVCREHMPPEPDVVTPPGLTTPSERPGGAD